MPFDTTSDAINPLLKEMRPDSADSLACRSFDVRAVIAKQLSKYWRAFSMGMLPAFEHPLEALPRDLIASSNSVDILTPEIYEDVLWTSTSVPGSVDERKLA